MQDRVFSLLILSHRWLYDISVCLIALNLATNIATITFVGYNFRESANLRCADELYSTA